MNVGDYIRTNDGYINKIKKVNQWNVLVDARDLFGEEINIANNEIIKSSPNIIDLIEVGDYVNGRYVDKYQGKLGNFCELPNGKWEFIEISNEHYLISSIVTREMFESMEYKVGD